jgi:hypothetical protein
MFKRVACAVLLACVIPSSSAVAANDAAPARSPRVRPHDARSASVLLQGIQRSETVRLIVNRLEAQDVIVYIEMQPALRGDLAGRMVWLAATQSIRYVRVSLNPQLSTETLVAVLGHELQHALEVASSPSIVDEPSLEAYYRKHGMSTRSHVSGWDTQAARDAGDLVRKELATSPARTVVESTLAFDASTWNGVYRRARDRSDSR